MTKDIFKPTCLENCSVFRDLRARSALALRLFTLGRLVPASESEKFGLFRISTFTKLHLHSLVALLLCLLLSTEAAEDGLGSSLVYWYFSPTLARASSHSSIWGREDKRLF